MGQQTDDNNSKRFHILDKKNEDRTQNLEIEIRSEQRAGFNVISEQLYCLTQVAIQTLSAVATSSNSNDNDNESITNEKLLGYCDKAQEMADTILSDEHMLKTKENNLKDIKAEIQLRNGNKNNIIMMEANDITPGGPENVDGDNQFDFNQNQSTVITNVSSSSYKHKKQQNENNIISSTLQMKPIQIGHYIYDNKEYVILGSGIMFALYVGNKAIDYMSSPSTNNNNI